MSVEKYCKVINRYEDKISELFVSEESLDKFLESDDVMSKIYSFVLFLTHYAKNYCFLEEGQLLRDAYKIQDIPTVIVNGRYDMLCPPIYAYRLHKKLPKSKLIIAEKAGHWMGEKPIESELLKAMRGFE